MASRGNFEKVKKAAIKKESCECGCWVARVAYGSWRRFPSWGAAADYLRERAR